MNAALGEAWEEWQVTRDADEGWNAAATELHTRWWEGRIGRQKEIDASIAAKADFEYLYDKPYEDRNIVRVAGPFTVESLLPAPGSSPSGRTTSLWTPHERRGTATGRPRTSRA